VRVIIADDESPARERLRTLLSRFDDVEIVAEAADGEAAVAALDAHAPDALFLDIRMPGLTGLDIADLVRFREPKPQVVFISAYDAHALEAFELDVTDYLTKPVRPSRLADTLNRIRARLTEPVAGERRTSTDKLGVPAGGKTVLIETGAIISATVTSGLVELACTDRVHHLSWTLKQLEEKLAGDARFEKVSRQAIVNLDRVTRIEPFFSGTAKLLMEDGSKIDASRTATRQLKQRFS